MGEDPEVDGMTTLNQIKLINNYLDKRGIKRSMNTSEGNLGDIWTQRAIGIIKMVSILADQLFQMGQGILL